MIEKLVEYWEMKEPFTLFYKTKDLDLRMDILINEIIPEGDKLWIYFNEEDYFCINPSEYVEREEYDLEFVNDNGDLIAFVGEVEPC